MITVKTKTSPAYEVVSWVFLRFLGLIYLIAFISFLTQSLGLIGSRGIIPLVEFMNILQMHLGIERYWLVPMVFWLNASDMTIQVICWGGVIASLFLIFNLLPRINLLIIYLFYLSLVYAGQYFMTFQWDLFLLESCLLGIILLTWQTVGIWLIRWLLFRFIFAAGLVKIFSGDSSWHDFTALNYYFFTEPLPTPLAWYANQLPQYWLSIGTGATLFIELVIPFLIFMPRSFRFFSAYLILFLQTIILITGNYNFFNLMTMVLCLILFDDAALQKIIPHRLFKFIAKYNSYPRPYRVTRWAVSLVAVFTIALSMIQFGIKFGLSFPEPIIAVYDRVEPFRIVNMYGPFAVMTKERMEIVIEGSSDGENWKEYNFKYKPGDVTRAPLWNIPFQPRLDWQMWFAALSSPEANPWFSHLLQRVLEGSPYVLALLGSNPFPDAPPRYIRAQFYEYTFTNDEQRKKSGAWWDRRLVRLYFLEAHL